ncbi:MAG: hypothetical protein FJ358_07075 [Thaumarchaeota archaeon]|nr:hypothetical protein [Nitrososphaerota archaeon]
MNRYTAISILLAVSLMAMTSLFAAFMVSFGANDRNIGFMLLLLIYLFGVLSILSAVYLEKLEKSRSKALQDNK